MTGFEYGNTRVRAMWSRLLDEDAYEHLLAARDVDALLAALSSGPYGEAVGRALARGRGLRAVDEALSEDLAATLRQVAGFYDPVPGDLLLLFSRRDLDDLETVLRGVARRLPAEEIVPLLCSPGPTERAVFERLAGARSLREAIDLAVQFRVPDAATAAALLAAWPRYDREGRLEVLEHAIESAAAAAVARALSGRDDPRARLFLRRIDLRNLVGALRVLGARIAGTLPAADVEPEAWLLPGGLVTGAALVAAALAEDRSSAADALSAARVPASWAAALEGWRQDGDVRRLHDVLEADLLEQAVALLRIGDPLGADVPFAFVHAKEAEVRNLRLVARAVDHVLPLAVVRDALVVVR